MFWDSEEKLYGEMTQVERVKQYMLDKRSITQLEALKDIGVMRLASRISDLRKIGVPIESKFVVVRNRYGEDIKIKRYWIALDLDKKSEI